MYRIVLVINSAFNQVSKKVYEKYTLYRKEYIMKISVMGINENELLSGKALAEMGNEVIHICKDNAHVEDMKKGLYSTNEREIYKVANNRGIDFTSNMQEALSQSNMCFISENNTQDAGELFHILATAKEIGTYMNSHTFIVDRSPLPMSRTEQIKETIQYELDKRSSNLTFEVISNPNFLRA